MDSLTTPKKKFSCLCGKIIKRLADIILSLLAMIVVSPVFIIVSVLIKLTGEDVFFFQKRIGQYEKDINLIKFTTMPKGSEKSGSITTSADPRPSKLGKYLRKTKINEMPQLINIFIGSMSIVGPRPLLREHAEIYPEEKRRKIYSMKPGLIGIGSLYFHDEDSLLASVDNTTQYYEEVIMPKKAELELWYNQNWNILLDCRLCLLSLLILLRLKREIGLGSEQVSSLNE